MGTARPFAADVPEAIVDEPSHENIDDPVVALTSFIASRHELEVSQERELMADCGHGQPQGVGKIADAQLVVSEGMHQAETERVRQREEHLDGLRRGFLRRK
jgi:hypothetical protein